MTARHIARIRGLLAELGQALDEAEAETPAARAPQQRRTVTSAPEVRASRQTVDKIRRVLRSKGVQV